MLCISRSATAEPPLTDLYGRIALAFRVNSLFRSARAFRLTADELEQLSVIRAYCLLVAYDKKLDQPGGS
jgi:hypothetical protein